MTTSLILPYLTPTLNSRVHWSTKSKLVQKYQYDIRGQTRNRHQGAVRLEFYRHSTGVQMDYDNLVSAGKLVLDALQRAGVLTGDGPDVIREHHYEHVRVMRKELQKTIIIIKDL